jgi:hypothetical protein
MEIDQLRPSSLTLWEHPGIRAGAELQAISHHQRRQAARRRAGEAMYTPAGRPLTGAKAATYTKWAAGDWDRATGLLTEHWPSPHLDGQDATTHELLAGFPSGVLAADTALAAPGPVLDGSVRVGWQGWLTQAFLLTAIAQEALGDHGASDDYLEQQAVGWLTRDDSGARRIAGPPCSGAGTPG